MILAFFLLLMVIPVLYLIPCDKPEEGQGDNDNLEAIAKADHFVDAAPWNRG